MTTRRNLLLGMSGLIAGAGLAACGDSPNSKNSKGTTVLNVGMPNGTQTENHNPYLPSAASASLGYRYMIYEPLAMFNRVKPAEKPAPWLATKWEWSTDYKKLTVTVRDGVTWSDGKPLSAEDVAFTFQQLKKYPGLNIDAIPYSEITSSGTQVTLTFTKPQFVNQMKILHTLVVPKHQWSAMSDPATDPVKQPIGSGPYTLKSFTPQTVTLTLRDKYWQELPQVKELRYTSYNDNNAQTTALANGEAEWSFVFVPNYKTVYVAKDPEHYKLWFPPDLAVHGLFINCTRKPFDNPVLRRAMSMAINREDIFQQGEAGYFYPKVDNIAGMPTPAGEPYLAAEYKGKTQAVDVDGAKKLLTGAGFTFDGNTLKDPTGAAVKLTLSNPAGWSDYVTDLEIIKDNLSKIGIAATVDKANQDAWTKSVDEGTFEASMHWSNGGATPYELYQSIMDGALYKPVGTAGVNGNWGRFQNADATKALDDYANATADAARTTALNTLQKVMVEQMPMIATSAANLGGLYSTRHWVGWPDESNQYAAAQPTLINALQVILKLRPAS